MDPTSAFLALPLALGGESLTRSNTALAIVSLISMVFVYALLAALWYFVFRDKARARKNKDSAD
ncbi:MAG TPA: hypothetical protein VII01_16005, partial [Solirubrobacteraceae bacterium]